MPDIEHVFVLMLENRSFDHLLGKSGIPGLNGLTGNETSPYNGKNYGITRASIGPMDVDPGHEFPDVVEQLAGKGATFPHGGPYPPINNSGYAESFMRTSGAKVNAAPGLAMSAFAPQDLPVLNALAREFAICDRWHSSLPGPTLPNRFFLLAATSGGLDHSPTDAEMIEELTIDGFPIRNGTIFSQPIKTRIYCGGILCMAQTLKGVNFLDVHRYSNFVRDVTSGSYNVKFTLIEPDYGDLIGNFKGGTSQHPMDGMTGGEGLIKQVYETIRSSPLWTKSILFVMWDEHGGFYDHVVPPKAVPPGDAPVTPRANQFGFDFSLYGPRVPCVVISPFIPQGTVDHTLYDHASVPATVEKIFGLQPMTERDKHANTVLSLLSLPTARATPEYLPVPAPPPPQPHAAVDKSVPPHFGNVPAFLVAAARSDLHLSPPEVRAQILAKVKSLPTLAHAEQYMHEVGQKILAVRGGSGEQGADHIATHVG
jgi:phospholipase C